MSTNANSEPAAQTAKELSTLIPVNVEHLTTASERFMEGMTSLMSEQMELGRLMMEGGVEDFRLLAQATTPENFIKAELEVMNRRQGRAAVAMQRFTDRFTKAFSEVHAAADPAPANARAPASPDPAPRHAPN